MSLKEIKGYTEQKIDRKGFAILNEIKGSINQEFKCYFVCK